MVSFHASFSAPGAMHKEKTKSSSMESVRTAMAAVQSPDGSKNWAPPSLQFSTTTAVAASTLLGPSVLLLLHLDLAAHSSVDSQLEEIVDTVHFLARALHIRRAHLSRDTRALLASYRGQPLGFEHVDAGFLVAEIGFEADEDERCSLAEMEDFRIPLNSR